MPCHGDSEHPALREGRSRPDGSVRPRSIARSRIRVERLALSLCVSGALLGALGLVDDIAEAGLWVAFLPHEPPTTRTAALGLLFAGAAAALRCRPRTGRLVRSISILAAVAALAIGAVAVFGHVFARDPVDLLTLLGTDGGTRLAPLAAACVVLLALATLLIDVRPAARAGPSEWLALSAWIGAFTALLGYVFGAAVLYRFARAPLIGVTPPAVVSLLLTATGLLFARPTTGFMRMATARGMSGALLRRLTLVAIVTPVVVGVAALHVLRALGVAAPTVLGAVMATVTTVVATGIVAAIAAPFNRTYEAFELSHADLVRAQAVAEVGSWCLDVRRNVFDGSDEACRIFGIPPGTSLTYEAFLERVHPDDRASVDAAWKAALSGVPYDIEHRIVVSGEVRWVRDKAELHFDEERRLVGAFGITLDITHRKRIEEALRLSEEKAAGIVAISADAIICIDEHQRITLFNEGAEATFGYKKAEVLGEPIEILIPERFRRRHHELVKQFMAGNKKAFRIGERASTVAGLRKSGEEFRADAAISKLSVNGNTVLTVALRDVTEQERHQEEQAQLSELGSALASTLELDARLASIARIATKRIADVCMLFLVEHDGRVRRLRVTSRRPEHGWACEVLMRFPFESSREPSVWDELLANRPVIVDEVTDERLVRLAHDDEHLRALRALEPRSAMALPLFAHGKLVGLMLLVASAGSRAYSAADLRFASQVAQRAAYAIDGAQLYAAACQAIESRDRVLRIVAHDLRNPLGNILMQAALLEGHDTRAGAIVRSCRRMNRIIQDLLDVTTMEEGRLAFEPRAVSVREALASALEGEQMLASAASLELELEADRDLPEVWADRDRLLQILENLIGNALKFTPAGGNIKVGAAPKAGEVLFWVADTGPGISPEEVCHVFDRFWQAHRGRRHGVGLGLDIVRGLVEAHGGRVWVESTVGRGTTVFFTMPTATTTGEPQRLSARS
jgi:PAS domain S-box-containing protein